MGVVLGAKARRALRSATIGYGYGICLINYGSLLCKERNHLPVPHLVRALIVWFAD